MNAILKRIRKLPDHDLYSLSDAIDAELERRAQLAEEDYDSARRRAVERQSSYKRRNGAFAQPVKAAAWERQLAGKPDFTYCVSVSEQHAGQQHVSRKRHVLANYIFPVSTTMSKKTMKVATPEPEVILLRIHQELDPPPDDDRGPRIPEEERETQVEAFWAGRSLAMRRSARVAA
jgi:hypothetical protein